MPGIRPALRDGVRRSCTVRERLVARHDLVPTRYDDLVGWAFGEFIVTSGLDDVSSSKLR
ncbi:MAG TPA: hypothetical protein VGO95_09495 [Modestobacter sp.]|nr:hypothetical protein [Modestobacter sp.]